MTGARDSRSRARLAIFVAVALLAGAHVAWQGWLVAASPYPAVYDYDEGVYSETARAAAAGAGLYSEIFLSQPPLLIGALSRAFIMFGPTLATARGVIVAFSVIWLVSLGAVATTGGCRRAAIWAIAAALSAPAFAAASHTVQMEAPAEALAALAVALSLTAARRTGTTGAADALWAAAGAAAGLAIMTKITAFTCLVPLVAAGGGRRPRTLAVLASGIAAAAAAAAVWTGAAPGGMWRDAAAFHIAVARAMPFDPGRAAQVLRAFAAENWLLATLGLGGLAAVLRRPGVVPGRVAAAWLLADLATVLAAHPLWPHHLVILISPLALLSAAGVETLAARGRLPSAALVVLWAAAVAAGCVALRPAVSTALADAAADVRAAIPPGDELVADDPMVAFLGGRPVPPALCDTSEARAESGWLTESMLRAALGDRRVRGVVLWRGTFRRLFPAVAGEAAKDFPRRWTTRGGGVILSR